MKSVNVFFAVMALTVVAFFPAAVRAGDLEGLDVTMEVLDDVGDLEATVSEMRGPDEGEIGGGVGEDEEGGEPVETDGETPDEVSEDEEEGALEEDEFEEDGEFEEDEFEEDGEFEEDEMEDEDDFEDGEDVDEDEIQEFEPEEEDEEEHHPGGDELD